MDQPASDDTDRQMGTEGGRLDVVFDIDLGELISGHHVIAQGIERWHHQHSSSPPEEPNAFLHFDVVPAIEEAEEQSRGFQFDIWELSAEDAVATPYGRSGYNGFLDEAGGSGITRGYLSLGAEIPDGVRLLTLRFQPAVGWKPSEPWVRKLVIDLRRGAVADVLRT